MIHRVIEFPEWLPNALLSIIIIIGLSLLWIFLKEAYHYYHGSPLRITNLPPPPPEGHWIKLEKVWHESDKKPNNGDVCLVEKLFTYSIGTGFYTAYWLDERGYFTMSGTLQAINADEVVRWARIKDLTPKE